MEICGRLISVSAYGDWGRGMLEIGSGEKVPVVGRGLAGLEEAELYRFRGEYVQHPKYGRQFDVADALVDAPSEAAGVVKFIQRHYKGCGEKTAGAILDWYSAHGGGLAKLRSDVVNRPWELEKCPGIGARKIEYMDASGAGVEVHVTRRVSAEIAGARVHEQLVKKICEWLLKSGGQHAKDPVAWCVDRLRGDPYFGVLEVEEYTLKVADRIAEAMGVGRDHPGRVACVTHQAVTEEMRKGGHAWLNMGQAKRALQNADCRGSVEACVRISQQRGFPLEISDGRVYTSASLRAERLVAARLLSLLDEGSPIWNKSRDELDAAIARMEASKGGNFRLDESQRAALVGMLTSKVRLHTLTAWPGCGKTTFLEILSGLVSDTVFAAPYSKAAKVLHARIAKYGAASSTVHVMLEATGEGFRKNRANQVVARAIVLDEGGTVDLYLMASVLEAMSPWAHLIVVGDYDQLESVGAGRVLQDVVSIKLGDHHRLTQTHRNDGAILELVGLIRDGKFPKESPGESVVFVGDKRDNEVSFTSVIDLWLDTVAQHGFEQVGLLMGHRTGKRDVEGWNVTYANAQIQRMVNAPTAENRIPGCDVRVADRVIVRKPMTLKRLTADGEEEIVGRLANGDMGYVVGFKLGQKGVLECLKLKLDDGRTVDFPGNAVRKLDLGYAMTVHAAIGSEFDEVIVVIPEGGTGFLNRNLLLTAASRAKQKLWLVGRNEQLAKVAANERPRRNSAIAEIVNNQKRV